MARVQAGDLDRRIQVLALQKSGEIFSWEKDRAVWAKAGPDTKSNLFSSVGIGARGVTFTVRSDRRLTLHNAYRWGAQHCFLTAILPLADAPGYVQVQAALVNVVTCLATRTEDTVGAAGRPVAAETMRISFPGILTEKYAKYEREETHAENDTGYVLVVPKAISLKAGDLVTVQDGPAKAVYAVTICHVLDQFKNEYEIARRGDV